MVDTSYRVVWAKEPLLSQSSRAENANSAGKLCFNILAGRNEVCQTGCTVQPALATGHAQVMERQTMLEDGRVLWREARAYPIYDGSGLVALLAWISFDISHRKNRQSRQSQRRATLERSVAELTRLHLGELPFLSDLD
ncbi:hypothetical protein DFAR_3050002 [Desulfarculales bacterium]